MKLTIYFLFFFFLFSSSAFSISISPGKVEINFEPFLTLNVSYDITNTRGTNMMINTFVEGPLKEYIKVYMPESVILKPHETFSFKVEIKLPKSMEPGKHSSIIWGNEMSVKGTSMISTLLHIGSRIVVYVPFPKKYLILESFEIKNPKINQTVEFISSLKSLGNDTINECFVEIEIFNIKSNKSVAKLKSKKIKLYPLEKKNLEVKWLASGMEPGKYIAVYKAYYDGNYTSEKKKSFKLGLPGIKILSYPEKVKAGGIRKFDILFQSEWNEKIENFWIEGNGVNIKTGIRIPYFKSPIYSIKPWDKVIVPIYIDLTNAKPGPYRIDMSMYFLNRKEHETIFFDVIKDKDRFAILFIYLPFSISISLFLILILLGLKKHGKKKTSFLRN